MDNDGPRKNRRCIKEQYNIEVSRNIVSRASDALDYNNQKNLQVGEPSPDRNEQFEFISNTVKTFIEQGEPVISVDTGKKELVGNFINDGTEYRKKAIPGKRRTMISLWRISEKLTPMGFM